MHPLHVQHGSEQADVVVDSTKGLHPFEELQRTSEVSDSSGNDFKRSQQHIPPAGGTIHPGRETRRPKGDLKLVQYRGPLCYHVCTNNAHTETQRLRQ